MTFVEPTVTTATTTVASAATSTHEWLALGPWWAWPKTSDPVPRDGARATRPVIQKYADSRLAERFLTDPQDALRFLDDEDRYRTDRLLIDRSAGLELPTTATKKTTVLPRTASIVTPIRKLFRDTHNRFYLVVCSVHCDRPGLPRANRDDVFKAEFVIRRHRPSSPPDLTPAERADLRQKLATALAASVVHKEEVASLASQLTGLPSNDELMATLAATRGASDALALANARLAEARAGIGKTSGAGDLDALERWATGSAGEPASWRPVVLDSNGNQHTNPDGSLETTYPLYPLIPPDDQATHDGSHGAIWFGLIPTGSDESETNGLPRFSTEHDYSVQCLLHRRNPDCPDRVDKALQVWSEPTDRYRLASHTDALGLANRSVTLPAPDLNQLRAQAELMPPGSLSSARVEQAAGSRYSFPNDGEFPSGGTEETGDEVCFFAIPLITFVAMFLLQIFLPILLFILNLWWMLQLKFCIPPGASFDFDLSADILTGEPEFSIEMFAELSVGELAEVSANIKSQLEANFTSDQIDNIEAENTLAEQWQLLRNIQLAQEAAAAGTVRTGGALLPMARVEWEEVALR